MGENGEENIGQIISKVFIGESLKKIDIMNWWIEKLIREMHLENIIITSLHPFLHLIIE